MYKYVRTIALIFVTILIAGCGSSTTTTPVPPTDVAVSPTTTPAPLTAERLVDECVQAMGGMEKIDALETLRLAQHWPDHGLIRYEIKRPNLVRMGDNLVFDGERASWLEGRNAEGTPRLVPAEEWKDFEMDIAWYVPAFFDYPAEYMGTEIVDNIETHILQVTLPLGAVLTYNLDAQTYLVYRTSSDVTIGDKEYHMERTYSDYRLHDGILYPHAFTYAGRDGVKVLTATMETLEFNVPFEDEHFSIPTASETPPPLTGSGGGVIAFASDRDGRLAIHVMNADGSDQRKLTDFAGMEAYPDWSPDGKQIAFHAHHSSKIWSIHVMNADGSDRRRLTDSETWDAAPVWSPDGAQIAFSRDGDVWVMNADGSDQRQLTTDPADDNFADWSPDGAQIVFCSERDGNWEVYTMNADGTGPQRLTDNDADDWWPDWSPDGSQIAFKSGRDGNFEIYVMAAPGGPDAGGSDQQRLTDNFAEDGEPDWSPDGTQIAFESNLDGNFKIYVMNADGTDQKRLTETLARDIMPAWRP